MILVTGRRLSELEGVFRDHGLGARVRALEAEADAQDPKDIAADVAQAIRARYDPTPTLTAV